jgi:hypothetical protein
MPVDRGNRTYHVSDDRLRAFRALSVEEKLRWVEELAAFLRLARPAESAATSKTGKPKQPSSADNP